MNRLVRFLAPSALSVLAIGSLLASTRIDELPAPVERTPAPTPTAVLSARRVPVLLVADAAARSVVERVEAQLSAMPSAACLVVRDRDRTLVSREPDLALIPASGIKLLVAVAARHMLANDHRFVTRAVAESPRDGVTLKGDLFLVGGGDPLLTTIEYSARYPRQPQTRTSVETLADAVVASGITVIEGGVVGDESRYDTQRYLPTWRPIYITDHETGPMSALSLNDGFVAWKPRMVPAAHPAQAAAAVFADMLRARGVTVAGEPRHGIAPAASAEVARVESPPLTEVIAQMLRESDNQTAELLIKELGLVGAGAGTTVAGGTVAVDKVAAAGIDTSGVTMVDGSGLDRGNRLSCRFLVDLLDRDPWLLDAVAVAGESGTLEHRYRNDPARGRLRAKTGSIDGVAALVGVLTTDHGRQLRFAFVVNDLPSARLGTALQDGLIRALSPYPDPGDLERLGPEMPPG